jgi:rare lipoprotein A
MRRFLLPLTLALAAVAPATAHAQASTGGTAAPSGAPGAFALSGGGHAMVGRSVRFRGTVDRGHAGRTVVVESFSARKGAWTSEATATVAADGSFLARWRPLHIGRFPTRAVVSTGEASTAAASPELPLTVYRPAGATWYGPGLFGKRTACGVELTPELVGIAHRTLKCGTNVALSYRGRTLVVPVVDRGPYRAGMDWDLTQAAAQQLGFTHTDRLGAVSLR